MKGNSYGWKENDTVLAKESFAKLNKLNDLQKTEDGKLFPLMENVGVWWTGKSAEALESRASRMYQSVKAIREDTSLDLTQSLTYVAALIAKDRQYTNELAAFGGGNKIGTNVGTVGNGSINGAFSLEYLDWLTAVCGKQDVKAIGAQFLEMGIQMQQVYDVYVGLTENGVTAEHLKNLDKIGMTFYDVAKDYTGLGDRITDKKIYSYCLQGGEYFEKINAETPGSWKGILKGIAGSEELSRTTKIQLIDTTEGAGAYYRSTCTVNTPMTAMSKPKESEKELVRLCFEGVYPEKGKQMDDFFAKGNFSGYEQEIKEIKYVTYTAPQEYQTLFFRYIDKLDARLNTKSAYEPSVPGLSLNMSSMAANSYCSCETFFHEIGHAIDDLSVGSNGDDRSSMIYRNSSAENLDDLILEDVRENIRSMIEQKSNDSQNPYPLTQEQKDVVLRSLVVWDRTPEERVLCADNPQTGVFTNRTDSKELQKFQKQLCKEFKTSLILDNSTGSGCLSDIFGSVTGRQLEGGSYHKIDYWQKVIEETDSSGVRIRVDYEVGMPSSREYFAEMFSIGMTGDVYSAAEVAARMPKSSEAFNEIIRTVSEEND